MAIDEQGPEAATLPVEQDGAINTPIEMAPLAPETAAAPALKAKPVEPGERVSSVDVIRGVALLGILAMNAVDFAWPGSVYSIPVMDPEAGPFDTALWGLNHLIFDTKMMTLFSMLFGAGLVLMGDRAESRGARFRGVFYRRTFWLLVIGCCHAAFIWSGDILVPYALCGFLLYPFRRLRPRTLIITGLVFNCLLVPLLLGFRFGGVPYMRNTHQRVEADLREHRTVSWWDRKVHKGWKSMSKEELPKREDFLRNIAKHRGPYLDLVKERGKSLMWEPVGFLFGMWWMLGGRMLIGMGLMKLGIFAAAASRKAYAWMMILGYGIGLPLMLFDVWHQSSHNFFLGHRLWYALDGWPLITVLGSLPVVFGHIGLVMTICQTGAIPWLTRRLAAVGRMALSNYLFDSIFCTTLFYGYGGDFFGTIHRPLLYLIVLTIWTAQLLVSPLWLEVFRYGPAEWLWRTLTYWKFQPIWATPREPNTPAPVAA